MFLKKSLGSKLIKTYVFISVHAKGSYKWTCKANQGAINIKYPTQGIMTKCCMSIERK